MNKIVDHKTVRPDDLRPGNILVCIVKAVVGPGGTFRLYQADIEEGDCVPQGSRLSGKDELAAARCLFPSLTQVATPD